MYDQHSACLSESELPHLGTIFWFCLFYCEFHFSLWIIKIACVHAIHFHYLFICWQTLKAVAFPCEQNNNEKRCVVFLGWDTASFGSTSRNDIAGSYHTYIFSFWETTTSVSVIATPVYIPTNTEKGILFPCILCQSLVSCFPVKTAVKWSLKAFPICTYFSGS